MPSPGSALFYAGFILSGLSTGGGPSWLWASIKPTWQPPGTKSTPFGKVLAAVNGPG